MKLGSGWLLTVSSGLIFGCATPDDRPQPPPDTTATAIPPPAPSPRTVRADGIGTVRIGATVDELVSALGTRPARADSLDPRCDYLRVPDVLPGVWFMVIEGRLARIDVDSAGPATTEGVRVRDSAEKVLRLYAPRVVETPHKYTDGKYLTVTPAAPGDSIYRMIFETDGRAITRYRVGRLPEVGWVESCS